MPTNMKGCKNLTCMEDDQRGTQDALPILVNKQLYVMNDGNSDLR